MAWYVVDYTDVNRLRHDLAVIARHDGINISGQELRNLDIAQLAYKVAATVPYVVPQQFSSPRLQMDYSNTQFAADVDARCARTGKVHNFNDAIRLEERRQRVVSVTA